MFALSQVCLSPYGHIYDLLTGLNIKLVVGSMFMMLSRIRNDSTIHVKARAGSPNYQPIVYSI